MQTTNWLYKLMLALLEGAGAVYALADTIKRKRLRMKLRGRGANTPQAHSGVEAQG